MRGAVPGVIAVALSATGAHAAPETGSIAGLSARSKDGSLPAVEGRKAPGSVRAVVERPLDTFTPRISSESPFIYLNRCVGGCLVTGGPSNDARDLTSNIPTPGQYLVAEFATESGATGSAADAEWDALVQCVKEVYSPFAVTITDSEPTDTSFTEAVVGGFPSDIGWPADTLGVATISSNCSPVDNTLAFVFASAHPGTGMDYVDQICWTASQESAHAFGLDHEYQFTDGESACRDPMTYRTDCLGEKFFRDMRADCGEFSVRPCRCSDTQNSAAMIMSVFGPGTPITAPPVVAITFPDAGATIGDVVDANASAQRGVELLELFINGSRYSYAFSMVAYGAEGQPAADYTLTVPAAIPKGALSLVVRASDDLGISTDSAPVVVSNGPPCTQDSDCLTDQTCTGGLCVYPPPTLALGAACSYDQQCTTWECQDFSDGKACTTECEVDESTSCPATFTCVDGGDGHGRCVIAIGGGCCDAGRGSPWGSAALAVAILGLVGRRARSSASRASRRSR